MRHIVLFLLFLVSPTDVGAQFSRTNLPSQHISSPNPGHSSFGTSLTIAGDLLVVGAPRATVSDSVQAGIVYIYRNEIGGWVLQDSLTSHPFIGSRMRFGDEIVIVDSTNDKILVGAPGHSGNDSPPGRVFEYTNSGEGWDLRNTYSTGSKTLDGFGSSIVAESDQVLISALFGSAAGIHVFENTAGSDSIHATQHIEPPPSAFIAFGVEIKLTEDQLLVADSGNEYSDHLSLFAYTQSDSGWTFAESVDLPASATIGAGFDIQGEALLVQTKIDPFTSELDEAVYWYGRTQSVWEQKERIPAPRGGENFGREVVISGTLAFIGAPWATMWQTFDGRVYVYEFTGQAWSYCCTISSRVPMESGQFGGSMASDGVHLAISTHLVASTSPTVDIYELPSVVSAEQHSTNSIEAVSLDIYPNPSQATATVEVSLNLPARISLCIYDLLGRALECPVISSPVDSRAISEFDLSSYATGTYFVRLSSSRRSIDIVKKLVIF